MKKVLMVLTFVLLFAVTQQANAVSQSGTHGGYYWGLYTEGSGSATISFPSDASIKCDWTSGISCVGFGKGWKPGSVRTVQYVVNSRNNCKWQSVYGWTQNPLVEYYITDYGSHSGTSLGTLNSDGKTYNCVKYQRVNAPSIEGTKTFWQYKNSSTRSCSTGETVAVTMANHVNFWKSKGLGWGSVYDTVVYGESLSGPGSCQLTVGSGGGGTTSTTTTSGGGSTSTTSGGGSCTMTLRARSTDGQGHINLKVGGNTVGNWTLGSSMSDKSVTLYSSKGDCIVQYDNDASGRDVQIDYLKVCGSTRQAENQSTNTGVWQNGKCGGSYSEWLHCNGYIGFGNVSY